MDADIIRFLLCLLEEGDEPAAEQEVRARLRGLGTMRLAMLEALERMAGSPRCESHLIDEVMNTLDEGLFEALVGLCFNEIASFVHGCQNYLRQRREIEGAASPAAGTTDAGTRNSSKAPGGRTGGADGGGSRSASIMSTAGMAAAAGVGGVGGCSRRKECEGRFTEQKLEIAMDVARTCMSMFAHLAARGHGRRALHAGVLAHVNRHLHMANACLGYRFSLLPEWRAPLVRGGCLKLLVSAIAHATGPEAPPQAEASRVLRSAVGALRYITKLEGAGRLLVEVGGLPQLLRLSRSEHDDIRRDASQALKHIGHKSRDREKKSEAAEFPE
eukprot:g17169.t1